jgi:hypothetical protein
MLRRRPLLPLAEAVDAARQHYASFIDRCRTPAQYFRLTPQAEESTYALCFAIFGMHLLQRRDALNEGRELWHVVLHDAIRAAAAKRGAKPVHLEDKPYLQLLTFTLSALSILGTLQRDPLANQVQSALPRDVEAELRVSGALRGVPRSGNHAMFLGILLLHARDHLRMHTQPDIDRWLELHVQNMNAFGFWGRSSSMSHLQFQNGYHQYELLEHLGTHAAHWPVAAENVASLADAEGHFAPYPGGGGCYDYDAAFMLTGGGPEVAARHHDLLERTTNAILSEQNPDGGFCESHYIRPRSLGNLQRTAAHIAAGRGRARIERLRQGLTLLRPRHDRIHTHWSRYSRRWEESNLWDSWFRMLAVARIEVAFDPAKAGRWGFIDFPGIGFHPSLHPRSAP